jgi:TatD DNase family protein
VHSFDGDGEELEQLLELGFGIGLNGCSLKAQSNLDVAARVPLHALHLETDAPWCGIKRTHAGYKHVRPLISSSALSTAEPYAEVKKEKWVAGATVKDRSEPCHIVHVLQVIGGVREAEVDEASIATAAYANSMRAFWPNEA